MKKVGEFLKSARLEQGFSIEDMAEKTKIHPEKLNAIEEGLSEKLPAKVFALGLIKSYARALKVSGDEINQLCDEAFAPQADAVTTLSEEAPSQTNEDSGVGSDEQQPMGRFQIPKSLVFVFSFFVALGLLFSIYFVSEKMSSYSKEEQIPTDIFENTPPPKRKDKTSSNIKTNKKEDTKAPSQKPEAKSQAEDIPTQSAESIKPAQSVNSQKSLVKKEKPAPEPKQDPIPKIQNVKVPNETPTTQKPQEMINNEPTIDEVSDNFDENSQDEMVVYSDNKLVVTALESVKMEITWADGYVQKMLLKEQERKTLVFTSPIKVRIDNGGAVNINFNKKDQGVPGSLNEPIEIQFP
ncbi:MAG: helix-turn-helix domain-containing protein [Pseudomonadota bacterium]